MNTYTDTTAPDITTTTALDIINRNDRNPELNTDFNPDIDLDFDIEEVEAMLKEEEVGDEDPVLCWDRDKMILCIEGGKSFISIVSTIVPVLWGETIKGIPSKGKVKVRWNEVEFRVERRKTPLETKKEVIKEFWKAWCNNQYAMAIENAKKKKEPEARNLYKRIRDSGPVIWDLDVFFNRFEEMNVEALDVLLGADMLARCIEMYRREDRDRKIRAEYVIAGIKIVSASLRISPEVAKKSVKYLTEVGWNRANETVSALQVSGHLRAAGLL